jgi:hypothetical protein
MAPSLVSKEDVELLKVVAVNCPPAKSRGERANGWKEVVAAVTKATGQKIQWRAASLRVDLLLQHHDAGQLASGEGGTRDEARWAAQASAYLTTIRYLLEASTEGEGANLDEEDAEDEEEAAHVAVPSRDQGRVGVGRYLHPLPHVPLQSADHHHPSTIAVAAFHIAL